MDIVCPVAHERFSVTDVNILKYRLDNCPLVPVPPHGRMIDADAFESIKYELPNGQKSFNRGFHSGVQYVQRLIMNAPTIILADKEGEG
jgi:hypothetical protein